MNKKYTKYADLSYISKRLKMVEDQTHAEIYKRNKLVGLEYVGGNDYDSVGGATFMTKRTGGKQATENQSMNAGMLPNLSTSDYEEMRN